MLLSASQEWLWQHINARISSVDTLTFIVIFIKHFLYGIIDWILKTISDRMGGGVRWVRNRAH